MMKLRIRTTAIVAGIVAAVLSTSAAEAKGLEATHVTLPQGPGSIEGLGRAFAPSVAAGTASFGVDIVVPPGALDFAPKLSLDYDSSGGISDVGIGWRLGTLPCIRRSTQNGLPKFVASDVLEASGFPGGTSDLVKMPDGSYRLEFEAGAFLRVKPSGEGWVAQDKSGTTYDFGGENATEADGTNVVTWLLRKQTDLHGHVIQYTWKLRDGHGELEKVVYNDYGDDVRNVVAFGYEDAPAPHVSFASGIRQTFARRLKTVDVTQAGQLVRRYVLGYRAGQRSLLEKVDLFGRDGKTKLPTLSLTYTSARLAGDGQITTMTGAPSRSPADPNVEILDLDGDGLPDLLHTRTGQFRSYRNHDGIGWKAPVEWTSSPSAELATAGVQLADMDGDGAIDLVIKSGTTFRYLPGETATRFGTAVSIATVPNLSFEDPNVRLADMDGDRRTDVVITGPSGISIGYNVDGVDWKPAQLIGPVDPSQTLLFSDGHTQLCDMNGDGIRDLCTVRSGTVKYWVGRGRGKFEPARAASGVPTWDDASPWELHDLDGDGWPDLLHVGVNEVEYALATREGAFGEKRTIRGMPERSASVVVRYTDMNGNGSTDIVWIDGNAPAERAWRYLDVFPAGRDGLLTSIDNGLGKVTKITYDSASRDAARANDAGKPWTTRMNVALSVVRSTETSFGLADPPQHVDYKYRDGTWSKRDRTFAGFGGGVETRIGDAYTPTLIGESTFDTGVDDRTRRGLLLTREDRDESGRVFSRRREGHTSRVLADVAGRKLRYTFRSSEEVFHVEGTTTPRRTLSEWDEDRFGNVITERRWGEVVGDDKRFGNDEAITTRTFAIDEGRWILGRPSTEELKDGAGKRVRFRRRYYDGESFVGLPLGRVELGDVKREEEWVGPGADAFELVSATAHDADGHPIEVRDARGGAHVLAWNTHDRTSLRSESVKTNDDVFVETLDVDPALGVIVRVTGFSGDVTRYTYDPLGRLEKIIRPGDTEALPTIAYRYVQGAPLSRVITEKRTWSGKDTVERSEIVSDGGSRRRAVFTHLADGRIVQSSTAWLDATGNAYRVVRDRWATAADVANPPLRADGPAVEVWRDATGRTIRERTPLGLETKTVYEPLRAMRWNGAQSKAEPPYEGTPRITEQDGLGRVVKELDTLGGATVAVGYTRDAAGLLLSRTDPEGNVARYTYDGRGRRVTVDDPDAGHHRFVYDATGNVTAHESPTGTRRFTFDLLDRELTQDWDGDGKPEVVRTWDRSSREPSNPAHRGKLTKVVDPSGTTETVYDERGRLRRKWIAVDGATYEIGLGYDAQDRKRKYEYPGGAAMDIKYDARGLITGYDDALAITYDADGVEKERVFSSGAKVVYGYDDDRRQHDLVATSATGTVIQSVEWQFDGAGNVRKLVDRRAGVSAERDRTEDYVYDNLSRLVKTTGRWGSTTWDYSPSGNLRSRKSSVPELDAGELAYGSHAGPHAVTSHAGKEIRYDAGGRMLSDGVRTLTWDGADHVVRVVSTQNAVTDSTFDAEGTRRVRTEKAADGTIHKTIFLDDFSEVVDGKVQRFVAHAGRRILRWGESSVTPLAASTRASMGGCEAAGDARHGLFAIVAAVVALVVGRRSRHGLRAALLGAMVVAIVACDPKPFEGTTTTTALRRTTATDTLLFDDLVGSLTEVTDGAGEPKTTFASYPYGGTRRDTTAETRRYAGTPRDTAAGLDQMGARAYVPNVGTFASVDPVLVHDPERTVGHPFAAANAYAYASLTPQTARDATGHFPEWVKTVFDGFKRGVVAAHRWINEKAFDRAGYERATSPEYQRVKVDPLIGGMTDRMVRATPHAVESLVLMIGTGPLPRLPALSQYAKMNRALELLSKEELALTTFYRGTTFYEAAEVVEQGGLNAARIAEHQLAAQNAAHEGAYLTTQLDTARYFGELAATQGRGGGLAILKLEVKTMEFEAFAARNGIAFEAPVARMPGMTETLIPPANIGEFNLMCKICVVGGP